MLAVRIGDDLEKLLTSIAKEQKLTMSELVRRCLLDYVTSKDNAKTPWELGETFFGRHGSGRRDLSTRRKVLLKEKLRAKKGRC